MDIIKLSSEKLAETLIKQKKKNNNAEIKVDKIDDEKIQNHIIKYLRKKGYEPKIIDGHIIF